MIRGIIIAIVGLFGGCGLGELLQYLNIPLELGLLIIILSGMLFAIMVDWAVEVKPDRND